MAKQETNPEPNDTRGDMLDDELAPRDWASYEVVETPDGAYALDKLWRRNVADGSWIVFPVRFRIPHDADIRLARGRAHVLAAEDGITQEKDPIQFDSLDTICLLWRCMYDSSQLPDGSFTRIGIDERDLDKRLSLPMIEQAFKKLEGLKDLFDPSPADITDQEMLAVSIAIAKEGSLRPLLVFDGRSQTRYTVTLAKLHLELAAVTSSGS